MYQVASKRGSVPQKCGLGTAKERTDKSRLLPTQAQNLQTDFVVAAYRAPAELDYSRWAHQNRQRRLRHARPCGCQRFANADVFDKDTINQEPGHLGNKLLAIHDRVDVLLLLRKFHVSQHSHSAVLFVDRHALANLALRVIDDHANARDFSNEAVGGALVYCPPEPTARAASAAFVPPTCLSTN